jgi:2-polyprenyl-6-methoxyphenol hydroxylase-like FAD-dependent oxidoreductase
MNERSFHVVIVGGGLGGLCLAQGLKKAGVSVAVYERDRTRTDRLQGYRIHIDPDGSRALHECLPLDLFKAFDLTAGVETRGFNFVSHRLEELLHIDLTKVVVSDPIARHRAVSRITLRQVLLDGLENAVHFDKRFLRYEETPDGRVIAHFDDGSSAIGDILVGADGANSKVRGQFLPHADWHPQFHRLVRAADASTIASLKIRTSVPVSPWPTRNITLLGDAIHSMTPFRGIGANIALRDAAVLCRNLASAQRGQSTVLEAIHAYESEMLVYGFDAVRTSRRAMEQAHTDSRVGKAIAKVIFKTLNLVPPLKRRVFLGNT